jgi:hypothetical protein
MEAKCSQIENNLRESVVVSHRRFGILKSITVKLCSFVSSKSTELGLIARVSTFHRKLRRKLRRMEEDLKFYISVFTRTAFLFHQKKIARGSSYPTQKFQGLFRIPPTSSDFLIPMFLNTLFDPLVQLHFHFDSRYHANINICACIGEYYRLLWIHLWR